MITFVGKDGKEMRGLLFDLPEAEVGDLIVLTLHQTIEKIVRESI